MTTSSHLVPPRPRFRRDGVDDLGPQGGSVPLRDGPHGDDVVLPSHWTNYSGVTGSGTRTRSRSSTRSERKPESLKGVLDAHNRCPVSGEVIAEGGGQ